MVWQQKVGVTVTEISRHDPNDKPRIEDLEDLRMVDFTVAYLAGEAQVGGTVTVSIGLTNATDQEITLQFSSSQKVSVEVVNQRGEVLVPRKDPSGPATIETLKPLEGSHWNEQVYLDKAIFNANTAYVVRGYLNADFAASAAIIMMVRGNLP